MDKIITSTPLNSTAARVTGKGVHYEYQLKPAPEHVRASVNPLPTAIPAGTEAQKALASVVGQVFGRWRVIGYAAKQSKQKDGALYVVKCSCGRYEHRRMKAIKRAFETGDRCTDCQNLAFIKRRYKELGSKPLAAFTTSPTDGAAPGSTKVRHPQPSQGETA